MLSIRSILRNMFPDIIKVFLTKHLVKVDYFDSGFYSKFWNAKLTDSGQIQKMYLQSDLKTVILDSE